MRISFLTYTFLLALLVVAGRLFYWQVIEGDRLSREAKLQRSVAQVVPASRGEIYARDGKVLVGNESSYTLFASTVDLKEDITLVARKVAPYVFASQSEDRAALRLPEGMELPKISSEEIERDIKAKLSEQSLYVPLARGLKQNYADEIEKLGFFGLGFDPEPRRLYPEGPLAATALGFVGKTASGDPQGYFGIEGYYDDDLLGISGLERLERDPTGKPILIGPITRLSPQNGKNLKTSIDRYIQLVVEKHLAEGLARYGAKRAVAWVMNPKTGDILAAASLPAVDPRGYALFTEEFYKDGAISDTYEPGSTFKVVTMAAGLDLGIVSPVTECTECDGPFTVQGHSIRTWNNKYYAKGETMTKVLEHSNNVGAAWLATKIGQEKFWEYANAFGVGEPTGIDMQGEEVGVFYDWGSMQPIDLATASFGQGFSTTALKMLHIFGAIANEGKMMKPRFVTEVSEGEVVQEIATKEVGQVIKPQTARVLTQMLQSAIENGEARRIITPGYRVAGKTGTAQVAIAGKYDPTKTVASFVGFAPVEDPQFVMIVKYDEPTSSPFGAETAVPTFFNITKDLFGYFGIATGQ